MPRKLQPKAAHSLADNLTAAVAAISPAKVSSALGALVAARLKRSVARTQRTQLPTPSAVPTTTKARTAQRRIGKNKAYVVTSKWNSARNGTWRHHMIATIMAHSNTHAAAAANAECGVEKFASQRLDFNWAVDNGFINWA